MNKSFEFFVDNIVRAHDWESKNQRTLSGDFFKYNVSTED